MLHLHRSTLNLLQSEINMTTIAMRRRLWHEMTQNNSSLTEDEKPITQIVQELHDADVKRSDDAQVSQEEVLNLHQQDDNEQLNSENLQPIIEPKEASSVVESINSVKEKAENSSRPTTKKKKK